MAKLKNCEQCGGIFASIGNKDICQKCYQQEEKDFQTVYRFLTNRKNREAKMAEIVETTGVEEDLIIKFMKQNRLRVSQFPNLSYECEQCGNPITEGRLCQDCSSNIKSQWSQHDELERKNSGEKEKENPVYYTMNKKK